MTNNTQLEEMKENALLIMHDYADLEEGYRMAVDYLVSKPLTKEDRADALQVLGTEFNTLTDDNFREEISREINEIKNWTLMQDRKLEMLQKSIDNIVWSMKVNRKVLGDTRMLDEAFRALQNLQKDYKDSE
ncbi:hypothetical protein Goe24_02320 [Bacillus phage vB_BsuM-Goe24]|uniref:Uncharacterized protein n=1 Tax=Bacillus phage vB_BsuM-Goe3 TaxID=1933063 RepID=A0A217ERF0_BPGO3|nr:hypothetical protein HWB07_gp083 [Bacillus phage vB_BsuM-Goe3]APZ82687.1 hypothetical protein Goe3_c22600 [Bacillus phage vB_BsuM-Goe3]WCS69607.1 hypothetical protein Goe24_02320 [Bacillus phage vB_BsuM-Goe24]